MTVALSWARRFARARWRRGVVVALTLVTGTALLGISLHVEPGDSAFYLFTVLVAAVWVAGGLLSGPVRLGARPAGGGPRRLLAPFGVGLALGGAFLVGAFAVRLIPPLRSYVEHVLAHANSGSTLAVLGVTVLNGVAEEVFFRGALYAAVERTWPVLVSTVIYALATLATGNPMLVFAAVTVGAVLGLLRRSSGGILAPAVTHVTWSTLMLFALPPLFGG